MHKRCAVLAIIGCSAMLAGCFGTQARVEEPKNDKPPVLTARSSTATLLNLVVEGADYGTLSAFKQRLQKVPGVVKLYQQSFSADASSQLQVEYAGAVQSLADEIQALSSQQLAVEVLRFDPTKIELRLAGGM